MSLAYKHILVTGGAGFIGTNTVRALSNRGVAVTIVDDFSDVSKWRNLTHDNIDGLIKACDLASNLPSLTCVDAVIHLGAVSATTASNLEELIERNCCCSWMLWDWCTAARKPYVYASSAATYGNGEYGFSDSMSLENLCKLRPLNPYAWSKHIVDLRHVRHAHEKRDTPPRWYGLKFFNVYGPHEIHKGSMRSVACQMIENVKASRSVRLFKSYRPGYRDGEQSRDFVYVEDCVDMMMFLLSPENEAISGLYNLGSGRAEAFADVAEAVINALDTKAEIEYIDMPETIRDRYQYFTKADISKLRSAGYEATIKNVAQGVRAYVECWPEEV